MTDLTIDLCGNELTRAWCGNALSSAGAEQRAPADSHRVARNPGAVR
jgi:hypothetical protein